MQLEAIKHQGSRTSGQIDPKDAGKRSNEIVAAGSYTHLDEAVAVIDLLYGKTDQLQSGILDMYEALGGGTRCV